MRAVAQRVLDARVRGRCIVGSHRAGCSSTWASARTTNRRRTSGSRTSSPPYASSKTKPARCRASLIDIAGEVLVVSQFTLYGDVRRGRRPSFDDAAPPELAEALYLHVCEALRSRGLTVAPAAFARRCGSRRSRRPRHAAHRPREERSERMADSRRNPMIGLTGGIASGQEHRRAACCASSASQVVDADAARPRSGAQAVRGSRRS